MLWFAALITAAHCETPKAPDVMDQIQNTRAIISEDERRQREALSHLFVINKKVKEIAQRQESLNQRLLDQEATVRSLAQDVQVLETHAEKHKGMLNKRLRQLYQERNRDDFHWLFSAQSPVELERNHRFLRRMIDSDHRQLKIYLSGLHALIVKRAELKNMVGHLAVMQKQASRQEQELGDQLREKSKFLAELKKSKDLKLSELQGLRNQHSELNGVLTYAFFERRGLLKAPADAPIAREYGTYVDPLFRFRLTHKGLFYSITDQTEIHAVYSGHVVFASRMPGYGKTVIVDHGDNYYSVYAFAAKLKVSEGDDVKEGEVVAVSGQGSPLFGPGLYFEIRHFTDAIDPRPWIKDSVIKTAAEEKSYETIF